jgi:hypothetical protein
MSSEDVPTDTTGINIRQETEPYREVRPRPVGTRSEESRHKEGVAVKVDGHMNKSQLHPQRITFQRISTQE